MAKYVTVLLLLLVVAFLPYIILNRRSKAAAAKEAAEAAARKRTVRCPTCKKEQEVQADCQDWDCAACGSPVLRGGSVVRKGKRKGSKRTAQ